MSDPDKSLDYQMKSYKIDLELLGEKSSEVASDLDNIGFILASKKDPDKALEYYKRSLRTYKELSAKKVFIRQIFTVISDQFMEKNVIIPKLWKPTRKVCVQISVISMTAFILHVT